MQPFAFAVPRLPADVTKARHKDRRQDRYVIIDAARGLGILGIGLCNAPGFAAPLSQAERLPVFVSQTDQLLWVAEQTLMQGRFVALFSLLFGLSMLWVGGDGHDSVANARLTRRLCWLAVFGMLHGALLWWGDILLPYALTGLILRPCRCWSARRLLIVGMAAYATGVGLLRIDGLVALWNGGHIAEPLIQTIRLPPAPFLSLIKENATDWLTTLPQTLPSVMLTSGPLMLIGMGLWRANRFLPRTTCPRNLWFLVGGIAAALVSLPLALMQIGELSVHGGLRPTDLAFLSITVRLLLAPLGALGWLWIVTHTRNMQDMLAPVGRLALTAYLSQSLLARLCLFAAPGYYGGMTYASLMALAGFLVLLQAVAARFWCRRGWAGPAETVWRRLYRRT
ncbi:MAG: DUF418 domain-containing protein [Acetobacter sp.]|uniref:DUF418 domain-containing protein n=1 Tax=Acetobacter sp. TaxID=440 RepID=UPI0039EB3F8C